MFCIYNNTYLYSFITYINPPLSLKCGYIYICN